MNNTGEAGKIKILKASKIKDGIVRISFAAGMAAKKVTEQQHDVVNKAAALLKCDVSQVPARAEELFNVWKKARKLAKKKEPIPDLELSSTEEFKGDVLARTAEILKTQPEYIVKTIERFISEVEKFKSE